MHDVLSLRFAMLRRLRPGGSRSNYNYRRYLSTNAARSVPIRHSRHRLPRICTDPIERNELLQSLMEAKTGSLIVFRDIKDDSNYDIHSDAGEAWEAARRTVQTAEYVLRGYAHSIPGTQWNRWLPFDKIAQNESETSIDDNIKVLPTMQGLLDRLWDEGMAYMNLRNDRLIELNSRLLDVEEDVESVNASEFRSASQGMFQVKDVIEDLEKQKGSSSSSDSDSSSSSSDDDDDDETDASLQYLDDFAGPGPTTAMYDIVLDSMACRAATDPEVTPMAATHLLEDILWRNEMDAKVNDSNVVDRARTLPTVLSYNATIRVAANLALSEAPSSSSPAEAYQLRDETIHLALSTFDGLVHSPILDANHATYTYLLQTLDRTLPPESQRRKAHILHGLWTHACGAGVVDEGLFATYQQAMSPYESVVTNVPKTLRDVPQKCKRFGRVYRYHPREATY